MAGTKKGAETYRTKLLAIINRCGPITADQILALDDSLPRSGLWSAIRCLKRARAIRSFSGANPNSGDKHKHFVITFFAPLSGVYSPQWGKGRKRKQPAHTQKELRHLRAIAAAVRMLEKDGYTVTPPSQQSTP